MHEFTRAVEGTAFSTWVRESPSFFAFPLMLSLHAIGMGLAAGINSAVALRLLGAAPQIPIREMRRFFPAMWFGFWINAASGVVLLIAYPTKAFTNPVFYLKLALILSAMLMSGATARRAFAAENHAPPVGRALPAFSLATWAGAIVAGRLLAYTYTHILAGM